MTTSPTSQTSPWVLKNKAVLIHSPDAEASFVARLRIVHDQIASRGTISLSTKVDLANSGRSQVLVLLNIPPDRVEKCRLARKSNENLCPSRLLPMLPAPVTHVSAVSTLSLSLSMAGIVLCPSGMESISPAIPGDLNFVSFAKICQSKFLRLHFSARQFVNNELDKLQTFTSALRQGSLQTMPFDHGRHGVVQKDWRVFSLPPNPPSYCQKLVSDVSEPVDQPPQYSKQVIGKRSRDSRSLSPCNEAEKRRLISTPPRIGSPTEVNTPSTLSSLQASIKPTQFTRASSLSNNTLEYQLGRLSDEQIRELLVRAGRGHLLAKTKSVDRDLQPAGDNFSPQLEQIECRLERYIDDTISRRLSEYIDRTVADCRDHIHDEFTTNEAAFREQVDDGNSELRITANECMNELREQAQGYMVEIEDQAQQCMQDIENGAIEVEKQVFGPWSNFSTQSQIVKKELGPCSNASTQSQLDIKLSPSHEVGTHARRNSI
ncbi:hypothetical protein BDW74DRAFT_99293 [Aspergillus multicolor]|uniref:uncharacterized protein n=1 Tax=Aspergillus multicolor TaxID=41759 RepID=UPI003CCD58BC